LTGLFLLYGPVEKLRLVLINTAMYSSHYKFLATSLFGKEYIEKILADSVGEVRENTDAKKINVADRDEISCVPIKSDYYRGFIIRVANPRRIVLADTDNQDGETLEALANRRDALGGINASGYRDDRKRGLPWGYTVIDGVVVSGLSESDRHIVCGFNKDYILVAGNYTDSEINGIEFLWAVEFGPILLSNGEKPVMSEYAGGYAPRTAIGQTSDGAVLLVVIDGRQPASLGATFKDMQAIFQENGAVNACCLDGGSSSTIMFDGIVLNNPSEGIKERMLPNAILVKHYESMQNRR
jgi:exopolysaccharide biosynthesis protein